MKGNVFYLGVLFIRSDNECQTKIVCRLMGKCLFLAFFGAAASVASKKDTHAYAKTIF